MKSRWILPALVVMVIGLILAQPRAGLQRANALSIKGMTKLQRRLLSGFASYEAHSAVATGQARGTRLALRLRRGVAPAGGSMLCPGNLGSDVKVNRNCLNVADPDLQGRAQAENETAIALNPSNPSLLVAGFTDYRGGDGNCIGAFSTNGGGTWTNTLPPIGFIRGSAFGGVARQYWEASGDTSVAWDTRGNAYFACMAFQRGDFGLTNNPDQSSGIYVFRSTGDHGASWDFPGRPVVEQFTSGASSGVPLLDKPYMTVDDRVGSPFRDRIYVTWTLFDTDGTAKIFEAHSDDYGQTFSSPVLVSGSSSLCPVSVVGTGNCDANQFSQPFTGPHGALYVVFQNFNNSVSGSDNRNQILLAKSTDGGDSFGSLVKVADFYDLPDCATYQGGQDAFRACVPEKGSHQNSVFGAENYPSGAVDPANPSRVVVTFGSYINKDSKESNGCTPAGFASDGANEFTGVKTAGACNNKILVSVSTNGGASFTGTTTDPRALPVVNTAPGQIHTDQWWQWATFTPGGELAVSYYDRQYRSDETTGHMDISLSASSDLSHFVVGRVTSSSMPLPTQFPDPQGNSVLFGDYSGLAAGTDAHPLWMDTRDPDVFTCPATAMPGVPPALCGGVEPNGLVANDQNIFTRAALLP